ncbi:MAG: hypothetical protein ABSA39_21885 [Edaphobacter sp.]|jgi:hypothetical protein
MSNTPAIPPSSSAMPPFWHNEEDWLVVIEFLRRDDEEDRARGTEAIGYMFAFAQMTDTRMLALVGDPQADAYELLFSFSSPANKAEFLRLFQSNEETRCEDDMILVPRQDEIDAAQPIALVLPADVMREVTVIATMLSEGEPGTIQ